MTYHLGLGDQATPASITYGYFRVSDPAVRQQLTSAGIPNSALPEDRELRQVTGPWFQAFAVKRDGSVDYDIVNKNSRTSGSASYAMGESQLAQLKVALPLIPGGIERLTEQQADAEVAAARSASPTKPGGIVGPRASKPRASGGAMSYNTRIALGVAAGGLLLVVGLGYMMSRRS